MIIPLVMSCTGGHEYTGYVNLPVDGWPYGERCDYTVDLSGDSVATGMLMMTLTHDNNYEYSNLWVEVSYMTTTGLQVDTVNIAMCDMFGNWYGKGLPGNYQLTDTIVKHPVQLVDSSLMQIRHIMRVDTLNGISRIGVRFVKNI